jgi:hypothetical protein
MSPTQGPMSGNTQQSPGTDLHASGEIRTHDPSKRAAADPRLRPRDHGDRQMLNIMVSKLYQNNLVMPPAMAVNMNCAVVDNCQSEIRQVTRLHLYSCF